jgi:hypothetical protein
VRTGPRLFPFQPQLLIFFAEPDQFCFLIVGQAIVSLTLVPLGLFEPVPNGLCGWFELLRQLLQCPNRSDQFQDLLAKFL